MKNKRGEKLRVAISWLAGNICRLLMQVLDLLLVGLTHPTLLWANLRYLLYSLGRSPYRVQRFEQSLLQGRFSFMQDDDVYGETPWWTLRRMLVFLQAKADDCFIDLGSGNGRALYAAIVLFKMRAHGYEFLQSRHAVATHMLQSEQQKDRVQLHHELAWNADLSQADIVLLTWTCMAPHSRKKISQNLRQLQAGSRVIAITHPIELTDDFSLLRHSSMCFSWGRGEVYFYQKKARENPVKNDKSEY